MVILNYPASAMAGGTLSQVRVFVDSIELPFAYDQNDLNSGVVEGEVGRLYDERIHPRYPGLDQPNR